MTTRDTPPTHCGRDCPSSRGDTVIISRVGPIDNRAAPAAPNAKPLSSRSPPAARPVAQRQHRSRSSAATLIPGTAVYDCRGPPHSVQARSFDQTGFRALASRPHGPESVSRIPQLLRFLRAHSIRVTEVQERGAAGSCDSLTGSFGVQADAGQRRGPSPRS
jgi:hypothetical protein